MSPRRRPEPEVVFRADRDAIIAAARKLVSLRLDADTPFDREAAFALLKACGTNPAEACSKADPVPICERADSYVRGRALYSAAFMLGLPTNDDLAALRALLGSAS